MWEFQGYGGEKKRRGGGGKESYLLKNRLRARTLDSTFTTRRTKQQDEGNVSRCKMETDNDNDDNGDVDEGTHIVVDIPIID